MEEERRADNKELLFMMGEVHTQCKRIPIIEQKLEKQDDKIQACNTKSKLVHSTGSLIGGFIGGFIAVVGKRFLIG
jgi:hypothetical protein